MGTLSAESCPACGQRLPEEAQKAAQRRFEEEGGPARADAVDRASGAKEAKKSATSLLDIDTRVVRLDVSENDKELRIGYEEERPCAP